MSSNYYWLYPIIIMAGIIEACGPAMNGTLYKSVTNPWLASLMSFVPVMVILVLLLILFPKPMPTLIQLKQVPWWAFLGGIATCIAVVLTLVYVNKVGVGTFAGLIITSNLIMSVVIDKYGWFGTEVHPLSIPRAIGALLMIAGILLISKY